MLWVSMSLGVAADMESDEEEVVVVSGIEIWSGASMHMSCGGGGGGGEGVTVGGSRLGWRKL